MIASAPKRDEIVEENTSLMDYTQNLFAGLTFPEVPKSDPRNVHKKAARPSTLMMEEFEHDNVADSSMIELKVPSSRSAAMQQSVREDTRSPTKTTKAQITLSSQQFSMLYGPENCGSSVSYPSLPPLTADSSYYSGSILEHQPPPYEDMIKEEHEEIDDEDAPFLTPTVSRISADAREITAPQVQHEQQHDEELMADLVQENLRLQQQLQALQDSMAASASSATVSAVQLRVQAEEEQHLRQQQFHIQQQQEAYLAHQRAYQQQHQQRQQQQQQQPATSTGDASLKYVCCGNCRQWLSAPKDAVYVYCPGCEAVNNCAMRPSEAPNAPVNAPAQRPMRRVDDQQPWYLQCFSKILS